MVTQKILQRFDVYKDGGSISATFRCGQKQNELFFRIKCSSGSNPKTYCEPVLETYTPTKWTSPTIGVSFDDWECVIQPMSWKEASSLLRDFEPQLNDLSGDSQSLFDEMLHAAENDGLGRRNHLEDRLPA
jgi:hypothetical protein